MAGLWPYLEILILSLVTISPMQLHKDVFDQPPKSLYSLHYLIDMFSHFLYLFNSEIRSSINLISQSDGLKAENRTFFLWRNNRLYINNGRSHYEVIHCVLKL